LIQADRDRTFNRFSELPAELRKSVYEYYIADWMSDALYVPSQPPLARINRLIRSEVLPLFYSECRFILYFEQVKRNQPHLRPNDDSNFFLSNVSASHLSDIGKLELRVVCMITDIRMTLPFHVNLTTSPHVLLHRPNGPWYSRGFDAFGKKVVERMEQVVAKMLEGEGRKLRIEDISALRKVVEELNEEHQ
jgi:hypothetical protein